MAPTDLVDQVDTIPSEFGIEYYEGRLETAIARFEDSDCTSEFGRVLNDLAAYLYWRLGECGHSTWGDDKAIRLIHSVADCLEGTS